MVGVFDPPERNTAVLKYDITYTNLDGEKETRTLYFSFGRKDILSFPDRLAKRLQGTAPGDLATDGLQVARDVMEIVLLAYGERQGNRFVKSKKIRKRFKNSPAFEAFIGELLDKPGLFERFTREVFPPEIAKEAIKKAEELSSKTEE